MTTEERTARDNLRASLINAKVLATILEMKAAETQYPECSQEYQCIGEVLSNEIRSIMSST